MARILKKVLSDSAKPRRGVYDGGMKARKKKKPAARNPIAAALAARHGSTSTRMRDRRVRRPLDARHRDEW